MTIRYIIIHLKNYLRWIFFRNIDRHTTMFLTDKAGLCDVTRERIGLPSCQLGRVNSQNISS